MEKINKKIKILKDGPYVVYGDLPLAKEIIICDENGDSVGYEKREKFNCAGEYSLCRCGASKNKPFCDGSHTKVSFKGTETADRESFGSRCEKINGPDLDLDDLPELCARTRFCHDKKNDVWENTVCSDNPQAKEKAIRQASLCPAGRLVARNKDTGEKIEPELKQEIGLIEDPQKKASGPVWVKGSIEIEAADGHKYETRNRVTLCRCGKSRNKPFCDSCHIEEKFDDGDPSLK